jgi:hypothetical protein
MQGQKAQAYKFNLGIRPKFSRRAVVTYPRWEFRKMSRGEINVDPIEDEFFSMEVLGSLPDALIRE